MRKTTVLLLLLAMLTVQAQQQRYLGGDISLLPSYEQSGAVYRDSAGNTVQPLTFLKQQGWNAVRVRLFVDPKLAPQNFKDEGVCQDLDYALQLSKRVKKAGFSLLLDLHYSDFWADPGKQTIPQRWQNLGAEALKDSVYQYTKHVLKTFKKAGVTPDMIQVGNEISFGMLWPVGRIDPMKDDNWGTFSSLLRQGCKACREECPKAKIVIHTERAGQWDVTRSYYQHVKQSALDYDIIGLSYYPMWHERIPVLCNTLDSLHANFPDKDIMIVETAAYYSHDNDKWAKSPDQYAEFYPISDEGQRQFTTELMQALRPRSFVTGLFWWFPEENACNNDLVSCWINRGLFDNRTGQAKPAFYEFRFKAGSASMTTSGKAKPIDRKALVRRNNPVVTSADTLASLSVGNGGFAFTTDVTGLQTFPEYYSSGVPLGTQSEWGWHSFDNPEQYRIEESYVMYDFGHGHRELYATQPKSGRAKGAADWYRANPHRLHLGCIGLELPELKPADIKKPRQTLDMWTGQISSHFTAKGNKYVVTTACHPHRDIVSSQVQARHASINLRFPYPTGGHSDDACNWNANNRHHTTLVSQSDNSAILKRTIDNTVYYVTLSWQENAHLKEKAPNYWVLSTDGNQLTFSCEFLPTSPTTPTLPTFSATTSSSSAHWQRFWTDGAAVDFSHCKDRRARELERRVVLSQYLLAIQCAAGTPPQETGLTYNSWFGKFHLEMIWWHQTWLPLWGHGQMLDRTLRWYETVEPRAREIAMRQGFKGVRWMKMTDRSGEEAPSKVGSFLIWQQPHPIYLAELLYRANPSQEILQRYGHLVDETAEFMADFATYDSLNDRFVLRGMIPAQETLKAAETYNSPFELSSWYFGLRTAQKWRERRGLPRIPLWDDIISKLSPLAKDSEDRYLAAESAPDTYQTLALISDHPAVLGAVGIFPQSRLAAPQVMKHTQAWIWDNWNWDHTWGWDYPMVAMNAARLGEPDNAVSALLMNKRTNTYLPNGHNYQDQRLRCYLPGNGGLLTAIAMMCAGWDGCKEQNPGFPNNGRWDVRWEGLHPLP